MTITTDRMEPTDARWSAGAAFLEALVARNFTRVAETLAQDVTMRAMLPRGPIEEHGRDAVATAFAGWFGGSEGFELVDATVGDVGGRLSMSWRLRVSPAPFGKGEGWHLIEQHVYAAATERIDSIDLLCSGFRPVH